MHRDRLGSVVTITDENGNVVENKSYDPFGKPRKGTMDLVEPPTLKDVALASNFSLYTNHEHLDDAELIHMNGRVYDYNQGRFLSVDPFIQSPGNSQRMNPYSYLVNNPLAGIDPTGYVGQAAEDEPKEETVTKTERVYVPGSRTRVKVTSTVTKSAGGEITGTVTSNGKTDSYTAGEKGWTKDTPPSDLGSLGSGGGSVGGESSNVETKESRLKTSSNQQGNKKSSAKGKATAFGRYEGEEAKEIEAAIKTGLIQLRQTQTALLSNSAAADEILLASYGTISQEV